MKKTDKCPTNCSATLGEAIHLEGCLGFQNFYEQKLLTIKGFKPAISRMPVVHQSAFTTKLYVLCKFQFHNGYYLSNKLAFYMLRNWNISAIINKAGRLPENSRKSFVDLQSQKNSKIDQKNRLLIEGWSYILIKNLCKFLLPLVAAL